MTKLEFTKVAPLPENDLRSTRGKGRRIESVGYGI